MDVYEFIDIVFRIINTQFYPGVTPWMIIKLYVVILFGWAFVGYLINSISGGKI
jgi:hypothetical protein